MAKLLPIQIIYSLPLKIFKLLHIDRVETIPELGCPYNSKKYPADWSSKGNQGIGRIGAGNKEENRAVIEYSEDLLAILCKRMIQSDIVYIITIVAPYRCAYNTHCVSINAANTMFKLMQYLTMLQFHVVYC